MDGRTSRIDGHYRWTSQTDRLWMDAPTSRTDVRNIRHGRTSQMNELTGIADGRHRRTDVMDGRT